MFPIYTDSDILYLATVKDKPSEGVSASAAPTPAAAPYPPLSDKKSMKNILSQLLPSTPPLVYVPVSILGGGRHCNDEEDHVCL